MAKPLPAERQAILEANLKNVLSSSGRHLSRTGLEKAVWLVEQIMTDGQVDWETASKRVPEYILRSLMSDGYIGRTGQPLVLHPMRRTFVSLYN